MNAGEIKNGALPEDAGDDQKFDRTALPRARPSRLYSLKTWKDIATIAGVVVAVATFVKVVAKYTNQGKQQRVKHFLELRQALKSDIRFREILALVDAMPDSHEVPKRTLKEIPFADKRDLLGLFEEIAVMTNSGLISKELSHYFFGYYAIRCNDNEDFWHDTNKDSYYWAVFKHYVEDMRAVELAQFQEKLECAVLKNSRGILKRLLDAIATAKFDWRDSLLEAGFAYDVSAHLDWLRPMEDVPRLGDHD